MPPPPQGLWKPTASHAHNFSTMGQARAASAFTSPQIKQALTTMLFVYNVGVCASDEYAAGDHDFDAWMAAQEVYRAVWHCFAN